MSSLSYTDINQWKNSEVNVVTFYGVPISKNYLKIILRKKLLPLTIHDVDFTERLDILTGCFDDNWEYNEENLNFFALLSPQEGIFEEYLDLRIIGTEHRFFVVMGQEFEIFNSRRKHITPEKSGILEDKPDEKEVKKYNALMKELNLKPEKVRPVVFVTVGPLDRGGGYLYEREDK